MTDSMTCLNSPFGRIQKMTNSMTFLNSPFGRIQKMTGNITCEFSLRENSENVNMTYLSHS